MVSAKPPSMAISIHAPREGSDKFHWISGAPRQLFQSTLPVRGATLLALFSHTVSVFQSTLPVRGATALHAVQKEQNWRFQSTLPVRGATRAKLG